MSSRRRHLGFALLATVLAALVLTAPTAQAADKKPELAVSIQSLSPTTLKAGSTVTMTGTVTNHDQHPWTNVQAYLVIPHSPFTTRAQIEEAIDNTASYTGNRVTDLEAIDIMGDLAPGQSHGFEVTVPYDLLGLSGADGVYPVGVQILGTDTDGTRSNDAIGRATTFLPMISAKVDPVPASILWPFLMPDHRKANGDYANPAGLLASVSAGGQLRNLLDLASSVPGRSATVLIDPALLVAVDDLAHTRHLDDSFLMTEQQKAEAAQFVQDLLTYTRQQSYWILDYDRPDVLALAQNPDLSGPLSATITRATETALTTFQLSGRRVSWPTKNGVTSGLLRDLRGAGDSPVLVTPAALPDWEHRLGSLVKYQTRRGPVPVFVNDALDAGVPGGRSVTTVRQRILSEAALAVLQRGIDPDSHADAVTMVDPTWNPGAGWPTGELSKAFDAPFTTGTTLDELLTRSLATYDGSVPATSKAKPLSRAQLEAAADIVGKGDTLSSVIPQNGDVDEQRSRDVAELLGVRWRRDPSTGLAIAHSLAAQSGAELDKIAVEGPPSVTLSSSEGQFPLTIRNDTDEAIRIGVALDSSNPALSIPNVKPVDIAAGERRTLTVTIDLGRQNTTTLTARLVSAEGKTIGVPTDFNVRSSKVGVVLWIAMGLAGLLVLAALVRRFSRRRDHVSSEPLADDDD